MSVKTHNRTSARRAALQVLYQSEITNRAIIRILADKPCVSEEINLDSYARTLLEGVAAHKEEIDAQVGTVSENWALDRMPIVDRSILRLAIFEMTYVKEVPISVSINEAVELAKEFGGEDDSHRFVNGILGRIAKTLEAQDAPVAEQQDDAATDNAAE